MDTKALYDEQKRLLAETDRINQRLREIGDQLNNSPPHLFLIEYTANVVIANYDGNKPNDEEIISAIYEMAGNGHKLSNLGIDKCNISKLTKKDLPKLKKLKWHNQCPYGERVDSDTATILKNNV